MTITQTVEIPADRRVRFDFEVPHEIPTGRAVVEIQFPIRAAAQQETAPARRELTSEEAALFKVMPNPKMTAEEEAEYFRKNAEWLNKEAMDVFEDQKWIFESDERWENE